MMLNSLLHFAHSIIVIVISARFTSIGTRYKLLSIDRYIYLKKQSRNHSRSTDMSKSPEAKRQWPMEKNMWQSSVRVSLLLFLSYPSTQVHFALSTTTGSFERCRRHFSIYRIKFHLITNELEIESANRPHEPDLTK